MTTEVQERLAQSLHNAVWLTLGMERQDYRVQRPWSVVVQQSAVPLDAETRIVEVFDNPEFARQLLILGEPGAGKTTMMLELAEDLLQRARADNTQPIPVLLNLSSWKNPQQSIFDWLVGELKSKYGISQDLAQRWLKKHQLLPLLDGLDEVTPQHQQACAVALNAWLTGNIEQKPCGVLICCRREEYQEVVQQPLSLYGAVYLQALTIEQIEDYFTQFKLQDVWGTVQQDQALQKLLTKPLFLSMFGLVQTQGKFSLADWQLRITSEQKIEYLLDTYWDAAIERELIIDPIQRQQGILSKTYGKKPPPTRKAVRRSLVFAAKMLDRESSTDLLIEKMQPTALITRRQKWAYRLISGLIYGLVLGLINGSVWGLITRMMAGLIGSLIGGLTIGLIIGFIYNLYNLETIELVEEISISMSRQARQKIWQVIQKNLSYSLMIGLSSGVAIGLIVSPIAWLIIALICSANFLIITSLIFGLKADVQARIKPNQGIKNSLKNMLIVSMISFMFSLLLKLLLENLLIVTSKYLPSTLLKPLLEQLFTGIVASKSLGSKYYPFPFVVSIPITGLILLTVRLGGGDALIRHIALRLVLAWNRYAPLRYDLLLNYCTERLLLQRVGGRYRFMHKLLQDHFAKMDLE